MIYKLEDRPEPQIDPSSFVAPSADIIGWVKIEADVSVWFNAVVRGDNELITIGNRSNVQDCCVLHTDPGIPLTLENDVTIGHSAMIHGCHIKSGSLIGIGSVVLNNTVIGKNCIVGANALITENQVFDDGMLILGSPAKAIRTLNVKELETLATFSQSYVGKIPRYRNLELQSQTD